MENEIVVSSSVVNDTLTADDARKQVNLIQQIMKSVMLKDTHYGVVPGCGNKPTLLKAGAEKLINTFRLAVDPIVEDLSTPDCFRYRVTTRLTHQNTGVFMGSGIGEASSDEEKFKWRASVCQEEYDETADDRRRKKWKNDKYKGLIQILQVRTNPADLANTVLKIGKKRSLSDATLTTLGASDIFTQDIEDMPSEYLNQGTSKPVTDKPKAKEASKPVTVEKNLSIVGKIDNLEEMKRGKWDICEVTISGIKLSTFDKNETNRLNEAYANNDGVMVSYDITEKGGYTNNKIIAVETVKEDMI